MTMQDIQFFTSYQDEIIQTGKPPAPRIQVALAGQRLAIPVSVTTIARTDYVLAGGNPIADQASPHEITFGIVADDEEADLAQLMLDRYSQHPSRRAQLTDLHSVSQLIDSLQGLCNSQGTLFITVGKNLLPRFGNVPAFIAGRIIQESERLAAQYRATRHTPPLSRCPGL